MISLESKVSFAGQLVTLVSFVLLYNSGVVVNPCSFYGIGNLIFLSFII